MHESVTSRVPRRAWVVTFAGMSVNLCLGILYGWSVWKSSLLATPDHPPGEVMTGINAGWVYLTDAQATLAYAICGFVFALCMIPGGRLHDRFGPKFGATLGGLSLAAGCIIAGLMRSFTGLVIGFGLLGGIGMGLGYAVTTPAAVKWFGPHRRGLIVGLVVGGYGAAAIYISPLAKYLLTTYGISASFIGLGLWFALVVVVAGQLLSWPPAGYTPPAPPPGYKRAGSMSAVDWTAGEMLATRQFYALVLMYIGSAQAGLLVIANAMPMLRQTAGAIPFFRDNDWLLPAFAGLVNAVGRVGTGSYSDRIGRIRAYQLNGAACAACLALLPLIMGAAGSEIAVPLLFAAVAVVIWQYGGGLALMPAVTADYFGAKNLGFNYGLVFIGWGLAFFVALLGGYLKDWTGSLDTGWYMSCGIIVAAMILSLMIRRPAHAGQA